MTERDLTTHERFVAQTIGHVSDEISRLRTSFENHERGCTEWRKATRRQLDRLTEASEEATRRLRAVEHDTHVTRKTQASIADDDDEITGVHDTERLQHAARSQRARAHKMKRNARLIAPALITIGMALVEMWHQLAPLLKR